MTNSSPSAIANARLGLRLFSLYSLVYLAFALVNAFAPELSEWRPMGGVNLAIWWGMGLIVLALLMALVYGVLCRSEDSDEQRTATTAARPAKQELQQ